MKKYILIILATSAIFPSKLPNDVRWVTNSNEYKFLCHLNEYKLDCPVTLQDVKNHIGLKTNVAFESKRAWKNRIVNDYLKTLSYNIMKEETRGF